ncbi:T-cell activation Rho GTPase activating protein [Entamoeba marina]
MLSKIQTPPDDELLSNTVRKPHPRITVRNSNSGNSLKELSGNMLSNYPKVKKGTKHARIRRRTLAFNHNETKIEEETDLKEKEVDQPITEEETIKSLTTEIDSLVMEIKVARERGGELIKSHLQWKQFLENISNERKLAVGMKDNLKDITTRDLGFRSEISECADFMGEIYTKAFDQFAEQISCTESFYQGLRRFLDATNNYTKMRNDFDKLSSTYTKYDQRLQTMNKEKRPDINKVGQLQQQKEETFQSIVTEGEKLSDSYVDLYNQFLTLVLHSSVDVSESVSRGVMKWKRTFKEKGEKLNVWKGLNINEAMKKTGVEYPNWMDEEPLFINIFEAENHMVDTMEQCVMKYAKSLLCNPTLATTGLSLADIDLIFADIETLHSLHKTIFNELKDSTMDSFIDSFVKRSSQLYSVYKRRCIGFKDSMKCLNKCMTIPAFKDSIENIDNANVTLPRLDELLRIPFLYLSQMVPLFNKLKEDYLEQNEGIAELSYVFSSLSIASEQAEKENEVECQLMRITSLNLPTNCNRKYLDRLQCILNKTQGTLFLFSDVFIFTRLEKNIYVFDKTIDMNGLETFHVKNKKIVNVQCKEGTIDFVFKENQTADKCCKHLSGIKYEREKKKIFKAEIKSSTLGREEEAFLIPKVIHQILDELEKRAPSQEGIFRISVSIKELEEKMKEIDINMAYDVKPLSTHLLGNILKKYCLLLPNKLPVSLKTIQNDKDRITNIQQLLEPIGKSYLCFIERVFRLLNKIAKESKVNLMTADNLAKVISPNMYPDDDDHGMNIEKMTSTIHFMIEHYDEVFRHFKEITQQKIEKELFEIDHQKEIEKSLQSSKVLNEIKVSSLVSDQKDDKSVVLTLKDILRQGDVDMLEGKKWNRKWIVVKKNCLMIFKSIGEGQTQMVLPFKNLSMSFDTKMDKKCIVLKVDKHTVALVFDDINGWSTLFRSLLK